jgi:hypothetical protein
LVASRVEPQTDICLLRVSRTLALALPLVARDFPVHGRQAEMGSPLLEGLCKHLIVVQLCQWHRRRLNAERQQDANSMLFDRPGVKYEAPAKTLACAPARVDASLGT